jgi:prepilin-type N-terminal cleavage/methylation domain-containing protein
MIRSQLRRSSRSAFTLIELLSVIAIIGVLMAIAVGTYFRVRLSQEEGATETTIAKIHSQLDQQWRAVLDNARDESTSRPSKVPVNVLTLAGDDNLRAKAMWTKIRLKQEFPQTFWEALVWPRQMIGDSTVPPLPQPNFTISPFESKYAALIPLAQNTLPRDPTTMTAGDQYLESAALLYMALTKARRGNAGFNPTEHLGPHAVGKIRLQVTSAADMRDFDVFVDTWGQPICFIRWAFGARGTDLNQSPNLQLNKVGQPIDPQDPEKKLFDPRWDSNFRAMFINTVRHPLDLTQAPLNLSPVVFSAGRDKSIGIDADTSSGPDHGAVLTSDENDNVYSYRIKSGRTNN